MMSNGKICPLCGSDQIHSEKRKEKISDHYGGHETVELNYDLCEECGMDGDFAKTNDALITESINRQREQAVKVILQELSDNGINFAGLERSLELPQRTLSKWKTGAVSPSAAGVSLLKFLRVFPWLTIISDNNYMLNAPLVAYIVNYFEKQYPSSRLVEDSEASTPVDIETDYVLAEGVGHYVSIDQIGRSQCQPV